MTTEERARRTAELVISTIVRTQRDASEIIACALEEHTREVRDLAEAVMDALRVDCLAKCERLCKALEGKDRV